MPWTATKEGTLPSLKNKSIEYRKVFAKVANEALDKGMSEEEAIVAGLSAANSHERKKSSEIKKQLIAEREKANYVPSHIQLIKDAAIAKKQMQLDAIAESERLLTEKIKSVVSNDSSFIEDMRFDSDGKLVVKLKDGSSIKTANSAPSDVINKYVSVSVTEQIAAISDVQELNPVYSYNTNGDVTRIDYDSGNYKVFTYGTSGALIQLDYVKGAVTYRKTYNYDSNGTLLNIIDSTIGA